jgi:hypothetical protein
MLTTPGVEAWSPELTRRQLLSETHSEAGPQRAVLELRYIAARYGPPEIRALAKPDQLPVTHQPLIAVYIDGIRALARPDQLPGDPRRPQFRPSSWCRCSGRSCRRCRH